MIVKGIILSNMEPNSNKIKVRIPTFESAGVDKKAIMYALVAYNPGNLYSYKVDDVVIISFEHNQIDQPIILGKLYTGPEATASNHSFANSLEVTEKAKLPTTTTIGDISYPDLLSLVKEDKSTWTYDNNKTITMRYDNYGYLRIYLHNFNETDIGKYIWLYKSTRFKQKRYTHPERLGYGWTAGKWSGYTDENQEEWYFPDVPTWMPNDGKINVEWILTREIIETGYFDIYIGHDWLPLLCINTTKEYWNQIFGSSTYGAARPRKRTGCMKIKFGLVSKKHNLEVLSSDTLYFGRLHDEFEEDLVILSQAPELLDELNYAHMYITIK